VAIKIALAVALTVSFTIIIKLPIDMVETALNLTPKYEFVIQDNEILEFNLNAEERNHNSCS